MIKKNTQEQRQDAVPKWSRIGQEGTEAKAGEGKKKGGAGKPAPKKADKGKKAKEAVAKAKKATAR